MNRISLLFTKLAVASSIFALPAPLAAQPVEEITVIGRYERVPDSVQILSQAVSYADLDLSTKAGRDELRQRIALTARYLCDQLGEPTTSSPLTGSCHQDAASDALSRVGTLEATFAPRGTAWKPGPAWVPPYPQDWAHEHP